MTRAAGRRSGRWRVYAAPLLCAIVALWALASVCTPDGAQEAHGTAAEADRAGAGAAEAGPAGAGAAKMGPTDAEDASDGVADGARSAADGMAGGAEPDAGDGLTGADAADAADGLRDSLNDFAEGARDALAFGSGRPSSLQGFMDDLECADERDMPAAVNAVAWEERGALPYVAAAVLRSYEALEDATLVTSGYLDIKGNAWGALLRSGDGWVDVLAVFTEDDDESEVRVARLEERGDAG